MTFNPIGSETMNETHSNPEGMRRDSRDKKFLSEIVFDLIPHSTDFNHDTKIVTPQHTLSPYYQNN